MVKDNYKWIKRTACHSFIKKVIGKHITADPTVFYSLHIILEI